MARRSRADAGRSAAFRLLDALDIEFVEVIVLVIIVRYLEFALCREPDAPLGLALSEHTPPP